MKSFVPANDDKTSGCLYCGEKLRGRTDKKFCHDGCRNVYNNEQKAAVRASIKQVDMLLKKNRKILAEMLGTQSTAVVDKLTITRMGFNAIYHTHQLITVKHETYFYCYDLGWKDVDGGQRIMIVIDKSRQ